MADESSRPSLLGGTSRDKISVICYNTKIVKKPLNLECSHGQGRKYDQSTYLKLTAAEGLFLPTPLEKKSH